MHAGLPRSAPTISCSLREVGCPSALAREFIEDMKPLDSIVTIAIRACNVGDRARLEDLVKNSLSDNVFN